MEWTRNLSVQVMQETPNMGRRHAATAGKPEASVSLVATTTRADDLRTTGAFYFSDANVILPEQFFCPGGESFAAWTGARRLLFAVLEEALKTFLRYRNNCSRRGQRLFRETVAWFSSTNQHWLYSFESICQHLSLDADYIRDGLRHLEEADGRGFASLTLTRREKPPWSENRQFDQAA
jgi:hypothetical protein